MCMVSASEPSIRAAIQPSWRSNAILSAIGKFTVMLADLRTRAIPVNRDRDAALVGRSQTDGSGSP